MSGSLWMDEFSMLELDEIMRQREDGEFTQLLCRVWTANSTDQDIATLQSRCVSNDDPSYPHDALHIYRLNKNDDEQNILKLDKLAAIDCMKHSHTSQFYVTMSTSKANTGGLVGELCLVVGANVMLTVVSDGLVNGARGTVEAIITTSGEVSIVLVKFNHPRVGMSSIHKSQYRQDYPHAVLISRFEAVFRIQKRKTTEVSRTQFPLLLSWATTFTMCKGWHLTTLWLIWKEDDSLLVRCTWLLAEWKHWTRSFWPWSHLRVHTTMSSSWLILKIKR